MLLWRHVPFLRSYVRFSCRFRCANVTRTFDHVNANEERRRQPFMGTSRARPFDAAQQHCTIFVTLQGHRIGAAMVNTTTAECPADLISNQEFLIGSATLLLVSVASFVGNVFILFLLSRCQTLHSNVRLLLKNFAFCTSLLSLYFFGRSIYQFYIWAVGPIPTTHFRCTAYEVLFDIVLVNITLSIMAIGIDRLASTIWRRTYVDYGAPTRAGYAMLIACWGISVTMSCGILLYSFLDHDGQKAICYCHSWLSLPLYFTYLACPAFTFLDVSTMVCYVYLYYESRSVYMKFDIYSTEHSLTERHQILSNMKTTALLMPSLIMHTSSYAVVTTAILIIRVTMDKYGEGTSYINCTLLFTNLVAVEAACHPLLFMTRCPSVAKVARRYLPSWCKRLSSRKRKTVIQRGKTQPAPRFALFHTSKPHLVDFRVKPQLHDDILKAIWDTKPKDRQASS